MLYLTKPRVQLLRLPLLLALVLLSWSALAARAQPVTPPASVLELQETFVRVAEAVKPSVVAVVTRTTVAARAGGEEEFPEFPFQLPPELRRRFRFRVPDMEQRPVRGQGSGFVIDPDGYIMTNRHVVYGRPEVPEGTPLPTLTVRFPNDETDYPATIVGSDEGTDLAVIKVDRTGLQAAVLGDSAQLRAGDWVMGIGSPFGLGGTVTVGVISAVGRQLPPGVTGTWLSYADYIQTDVAINRGNSGGPLVDIYGRVVGVNTLILSPSGGNIGIGFAVPVDIARNVYAQIRAHGKVLRGWLGLSYQPITPELSERFGTSEGLIVNKVYPDSPAARADIKAADVIAAVNGIKIVDGRELARAIGEAGPSQTLRLDILRDRQPLTIEVTTAERPGEAEIAGGRITPAQPPRQPAVAAALGFRVAAPNSPEAQELGIDANASGVVAVEVNPQSNAWGKGLRPGHRILEINRVSIANLADFTAAAASIKSGDIVVLLVADPEHNTIWIGFKAGTAE